ncbi:MAG: CotH kinase family protein [Bacteroidales bacterium]|nr:CotH kinase family protein [Candidatus Cryptobacteroides caccocaballi]
MNSFCRFITAAVFIGLAAIACNPAQIDPSQEERPAPDFPDKSNPNNIVTALYINAPGVKEISSKEEWTTGAEIYLMDDKGTRTNLGVTSIKRRGNSSFYFPKHSYNLKLEVKQAVLGMPASKRWCLLAQWMDRTNLRNDVAFEVSRRFGMAWTPRGRFVKLYFNGDYRGLYYLVEKVKIAKNRINISDDGFIIDMDSNFDEAYKFRSEYFKMPVNIKEPDEDVITKEMFDNFKNYFNELEKRIYNKDASYTEMLDLDSFIKWALIQEVVGNAEYKHPKSVIMYKDVTGKLYSGPTWDHDWGTFVPNQKGFIIIWQHWYEAVSYDKTFYKRLKEIWQEVKPELADIDAYITARAKVIRKATADDDKLWPITQDENGDEHLSFDEAIERMKESFNARVQALDDYIYNYY